MDKEIIFFIIFVVFSILSSLLKRKKKPEQPPYAGNGDSPRAPQKKKPFSFDDILREFEAEAMGKQQADPREEYDTSEAEEERYERQPYSQDSYQKAAEVANERPSVYETYEGLTYDDVEKKEEDVLEKTKEKMEKLTKPQFTGNDFASELRGSEGLRKAVIMKEILDRKHF